MPTTSAAGSFGVHSSVSGALPVLALADEFRRRLCDLYQEEHDATIRLRDEHFPSLWAAMTAHETLRAQIWEAARAIKAHHSDVRDRNAVTAEQRRGLESLRSKAAAARAQLSERRAEYSAAMKRFREWWRSLADWKNVKTLDKRRQLYAAVTWPDDPFLRAFGAMFVDLDLRQRELFREFQDRGLHSAIRAEIVDASRPKLGKSGPGMRYFFGRRPEPHPWEKLPLHIVGGATMAALMSGAVPSLRVTQSDRRAGMLDVSQQIGTNDHPCTLAYRVGLHRPLPDDAVVNQWSLVIRRVKRLLVNREGRQREIEQLSAVVVPVIVSSALTKPQGGGLLTYSLHWSHRPDGVLVATFRGDHVNEDLILPHDLLDARQAVKPAQRECDRAANDFLATRHAAPQTGAKQGYEALQVFAAAHPDDWDARDLVDGMKLELYRAGRIAKRAERTIAHIYLTVARRVCSRHAVIVAHDWSLARAKKYDARDLLAQDALPAHIRERQHSCAVGKLTAALKQYGLASGDVPEGWQGIARETDVFTTYVAGWPEIAADTADGTAAARDPVPGDVI